jgi:hypothetical protein
MHVENSYSFSSGNTGYNIADIEFAHLKSPQLHAEVFGNGVTINCASV